MRVSALLAAAFLAVSCGKPVPAAVAPGAEKCAHCAMMIHDLRFHTQGFNSHGKARHFDSVECAAAYQADGQEKLDAIYAADFFHPKSYLSLLAGDGPRATLVRSPKIRSPMGAGVAAVGGASLGAALEKWGGETIPFAAAMRPAAGKPAAAPGPAAP